MRYHYFDVNVKIGDTVYLVSLECEEYKNVPQGNYAKRSSKSHWNNKNVNQTDNNVKVVHLYNIREKKKITTFNQPAYHGGAKDFDKFDLSYALSGEGAMAHGYGVYTAKNKDVSEGYRKRLTRSDVLYNGEKVNKNDTFLLRILEEIKNKGKGYYIYELKEELRKNTELLEEFKEEHSIEEIREDDYLDLKLSNLQDNVLSIQEKLDEANKIDETKIEYNKGQLFEVDIPEDDVLLDEDKSITGQSKKVNSALRELCRQEGFNYKALVFNMVEHTPYTGKQRYKNLKTFIKWNNEWEVQINKGISISDIEKISEIEATKQASLLLDKYGIKGIKYDGRQDGECVVVFDDKAVKILDKFYQDEERAKLNLKSKKQ